jgi:SAM-dependent methyltransferase
LDVCSTIMSETSKYRHLTTPYCNGNGVDIASQNDPVVPWAVSLDLPHDEYVTYSSGQAQENAIQWRGDCRDLPFKDGVCDWVYSSHLIEDFLNWKPIIKEWTRVLKMGGLLIILVPDKERWNAAIQKGQNPNCSHKHESYVGELSTYSAGMEVICDKLTDLMPEDYTIIFVARKL